MEKYKGKYRIESARLRHWDYGTAALYFITITTKNMMPHFGAIVNGELQLSEIGEIVKAEWEKTFELRPDMNLFMGEYVVMPDHFHAIIGIGKNEFNTNTNNITDTNTADPAANAFGPQSKNLASILRGFKSSVTIRARAINPEFAWHPRFHDRIIWSFSAYERISNYIINNPANWQDDDPNQK
jgi:REP element-mobilizing transposase RayT